MLAQPQRVDYITSMINIANQAITKQWNRSGQTLVLEAGQFGYLHASFDERVLYIGQVTTNAKYQRNGLGRRLLEVAFDEAELAGAQAITAVIASAAGFALCSRLYGAESMHGEVDGRPHQGAADYYDYTTGPALCVPTKHYGDQSNNLWLSFWEFEKE